MPQPLFLYFRRIKSWHKGNWKVFVFTLAFSVVGLVNHVFTVEPLAPINLRPLGMKPMTIMKCLTSKDEKNKEPKCSLQQSCVYAFPKHSLGEQHFHPPLTGRGMHGLEKALGLSRGYNCMAVWPSLTICSPSRIPVTVIRWFILPKISNIAVMSEVCVLKVRISSYGFSFLFFSNTSRPSIFGVEKLLSNMEPSFLSPVELSHFFG